MTSGAAAPEWTGIDKDIADRIPEDSKGMRKLEFLSLFTVALFVQSDAGLYCEMNFMRVHWWYKAYDVKRADRFCLWI